MPDLGKATYVVELLTKGATSALAQFEGAVDTATTNVDEQLTMMGAGFDAVGVAATKAAGTTKVAMDEVGAAAGKAAKESEGAAAATGVSWSAVGKKLDTVGKKMSGIGKKMSHKITLPVLAITGVAVKEALDYSNKLKTLETQAGASASEIKRMRGAILNLAKGTTQGPNALADAMYHIESVGVHGTAALKELKAASDGAMVGNTDLEATTYALVSATDTAIKGTETYQKAMAGLNAIVGAGDMRMEDLTSALSSGVLPMAKAVGLSLTDVGAALDVFTSRGTPAQAAATRLKQTFAIMEKPTQAQAKALAGLGVAQTDMARIMRGPGGLPAAVQYLHDKAMAVQDPVKRTQMLLEAFGGGRTGTSMLTLLQNYKDLEERAKQVNKTTKAYPAAIAAAKAEPINKLKTAWSNLRVALINLGNTAIPTLTKIATKVVALVNWFQKLPAPVKHLVGIFGLLLAVVGPLLVIFGSIAGAIGTLIGVFGTLTGVAGTLAGAAGLAGVTTSAGAVVGALGVAGIAGVAGVAGYALSTLIRKIPGWNSAFESFGSTLGGVAEKLGLIRGGVSSASKAAADSMTKSSVRGKLAFAYTQANKIKGNSSFAKSARDAKVASIMGSKGYTFHDAEVMAKAAKNAPGVDSGTSEHGGGKQGKPKPDTKDFPNPKGLGLGGGGKAKAFDYTTQQAWILLETASTIAARTKSTKDDDQAARDQITYLNGILKTHKLTAANALSIQQEITSLDLGIQSNLTTANKKKLAAAKKKQPTLANLLLPPKISIRISKAERTKALADDIAAWMVEKDYLTKLQKQHTKQNAERAAIEKKLSAADKTLADLRKKRKDAMKAAADARLQEVNEAQSLRAGYFGQFASDIFHESKDGLQMGSAVDPSAQLQTSKVIHYNQNNTYHEIPKDRHKTARQGRKAVAAAWAGPH